jgi:hypothetical protein
MMTSNENIGQQQLNWMLCVLLGLLSFIPSFFLSEYQISIKLFLFVFLTFLITQSKNSNDIFSTQDWPLWVFLFSLLGGVLFAIHKKIASAKYIDMSTSMFFLFYIGKALFQDGKSRRGILNLIFWCSGIVSLKGIGEVLFAYIVYFRRAVVPDVSLLFPSSFLGHYVPLAMYLLMTLPLGYYVFTQSAGRKRALALSVIGCNVVCLFCFFASNVFFCLVSVAFLFLFLEKKYKSIFLLLFCLLVIDYVSDYFPYPFNLFYLKDIAITSGQLVSDYLTVRLHMAWHVFLDTHFLGIGLLNFQFVFDKYFPDQTYLPFLSGALKKVDNIYFSLLVESGVIGIIGFFVFLFSLVRRLANSLHPIVDRELESLSIAVLCSLTAFLLYGNWNDALYVKGSFMFFCLLCGFMQGIACRKEPGAA